MIDTPVVINPPPVEYPDEDVGVGSEEAGSLDESLITFRQISTENGQTRRCEVKVLEHGDGYEVLHLVHSVMFRALCQVIWATGMTCFRSDK